MEQSQLQFPNKSHRKIITIPNDTKELAEIMGILFGDGGINNDWQIVISLNSELDVPYALYIKHLLEETFGISIAMRKRKNENTLKLAGSSISLVDFLVAKGSVRGNKVKPNIDIPFWIQSNNEYRKAFIKGLVDTDGYLYIHKHYSRNKIYINLEFFYTSFSQKLIFSVAKILEEYSIKPHLTQNNTRIYLYGEKPIIKYLEIFGSENPRIYEKYVSWRDARAV